MEKLMQILIDMHPDVDFETEEHLIEHKILDSFDIVMLISEIREAYGVTIGAKHIIPKNFNSAKAIYALICEVGKK